MALTDREREILMLVAQDKTTSEIAETLSVSTDTVKSHIRKICTKLGVRNRLGAVMIGLAKGEIDFEKVMSYWLKYPQKGDQKSLCRVMTS